MWGLPQNWDSQDLSLALHTRANISSDSQSKKYGNHFHTKIIKDIKLSLMKSEGHANISSLAQWETQTGCGINWNSR